MLRGWVEANADPTTIAEHVIPLIEQLDSLARRLGVEPGRVVLGLRRLFIEPPPSWAEVSALCDLLDDGGLPN